MAKNDDWLTVLEEKVEDAIVELESRRKRNAELEARLAEIESKGGDEADWEKERAEVRKRVEVLAEKLESLL